MDIIPSILTSDPQELKSLINQAEGKVDRVSIDIIDGVFAANKTVDPSALNFIETNLKLDFQLMVKEPIHWIEKCTRAAADCILGHVELMSDPAAFLAQVHERGLAAGLALDLATPISQLLPSALAKTEVILLMSVPAGFGGQQFDESALDKVQRLCQARSRLGLDFRIHVDGGVALDNLGKIAQAGADEVSVGRRLFRGDLAANLAAFQSAL